MNIWNWSFTDWFTFSVMSIALLFAVVYLLSLAWVNRDSISDNIARRKRRKIAPKEPQVCPEWADKRKFDYTKEDGE